MAFTTKTIVVGGRPKALAIQTYRLLVHAEKSGDDGEPIEYQGKTQRVAIGSGPGCDLILDDPGVSRSHCEITIEERGYCLRDLDSKNGTLLDGVPIIAAWLSPGSTIGVGDTRLAFEPSTVVNEIPVWPEDHFGELRGPSLEMRAMFALLDRVSSQDVTVLIEGESGTGKEVIVQEIHRHSPRSEGPLVVFDCSAVPENLAESELFGHVKGAFTGATSDHAGAFERAEGGTVFLDEIGELSPDLQPKLLRALEAREVRPVGGSEWVRCNVRVVAATNRNLAEEVKKEAFREDLYFRLNVVRIQVPPLRRRRDDITALVQHFIAVENPDDPPSVPADVLSVLRNHDWPGNVRELKNFIERYRIFTPSTASGAALLLDDPVARPGQSEGLQIPFDRPYKDVKAELIAQLEIQYFTRLLEEHNGNVAACARACGMHRKYLEELVRKHGLREKYKK